jgi:[protein-PII] uridylyltransferase
MDISELRELLQKGYGGAQLAALYTERTDALLRDIFASTDVHSGLCLIAIGGYGRGELAPHSDIDIMLFARDKAASKKATQFLYTLWDTHLTVGHSFRTPADCISEARKDIKTRTSLLEHRLISGDTDLYRYFMDHVYPEIAFRESRRFISEKLQEVELRHRKISDTVFVLEPHIKEGRGGLRDVHTLVWLASIKLRIRQFDELIKVIPPDDFARLKKAFDFLLKVRFCLHLLSGRRNDLLSFEFHERIAEMLTFKASQRFLSPERFMRYLYLKTSIINDISSRFLDRFGIPQRAFGEEGNGRIAAFFSGKKKITDDFILSKNRIIASDDTFARTPEKIFEAFYSMSKTGKRFSPKLGDAIKKNLFRINRRTRKSQRAVEFFMAIIRGDRAYETLRQMHRSGVLGRFLPEFGALSFLVVYEPYHRYTVDEHTMRAIKHLEDLKNTRYKKLEHLSSVYRRVRQKEALILSLLFHDIGKRGIAKSYRYGAGAGHHDEVGYTELKNIIERFNLSVELRGRIEFLVKNHLLMSSIAFTMETEDPEIIAQFADDVGDREALDTLYLLTFADMASVSPDFWTDWKAYLLRDLYETTARHLDGLMGGSCGGPEQILGADYLTQDEKEGIRHFLSLMPKRYIISATPERIYEDYRLSLEVVEKGFALRVQEDMSGGAEITMGAWDSPGLFSRAVGALSSLKMDICRARVYTGRGGMVIDKIQVSNWQSLAWEGFFRIVREKLKDAICGPEKHAQCEEVVQTIKDAPGYAHAATEVLGRFGPFIEIDNETSSENSVLEFFARDRLGLLFDVTSLIHEKDIDIISARINTESGIAHDIFSIQRHGKKVEGITIHELLLSLWERLTEKG